MPEPQRGTNDLSNESAAYDYEEELSDITRGDTAKNAVMQASLRQLARGSAGPVLQEMAREVLAGRLRLRHAVTSEAYGGAVFDGYEKFWAKLEQRSPEERERLVESGNKMLAKLRGKLTER
jgi:hypothetical protein